MPYGIRRSGPIRARRGTALPLDVAGVVRAGRPPSHAGGARAPRKRHDQLRTDIVSTNEAGRSTWSKKLRHISTGPCRFHPLKDLLAAFLERAKALVQRCAEPFQPLLGRVIFVMRAGALASEPLLVRQRSPNQP